MAAEKNQKEKMQEFMNALGAIAEMTLVFYRDLLAVGATQEEALKLTQAYIAASLYGHNSQPNS